MIPPVARNNGMAGISNTKTKKTNNKERVGSIRRKNTQLTFINKLEVFRLKAIDYLKLNLTKGGSTFAAPA